MDPDWILDQIVRTVYQCCPVGTVNKEQLTKETRLSSVQGLDFPYLSDVCSFRFKTRIMTHELQKITVGQLVERCR